MRKKNDVYFGLRGRMEPDRVQVCVSSVEHRSEHPTQLFVHVLDGPLLEIGAA